MRYRNQNTENRIQEEIVNGFNLNASPSEKFSCISPTHDGGDHGMPGRGCPVDI